MSGVADDEDFLRTPFLLVLAAAQWEGSGVLSARAGCFLLFLCLDSSGPVCCARSSNLVSRNSLVAAPPCRLPS